MKKYTLVNILAASLIALAPASVHGTSLHIEAGGLKAAIGNATGTTELTVTGTLNLADFEFMALEMNSLRTLDLSGARVTAYDGEAGFTGRTSSPADVLPAYALLGLPIENLTLPQGLKAIGDGAMAGIAVKQLDIPATVTSIGSRALADCNRLQSISLPASASSIGEGAFKGCSSMRSILFAGAPDSIAANSFAGCEALTSITLPASVRSIGADCFNGCSALKSVVFPAGLEHIGEKAFFGAGITSADLSACKGLRELAPWTFANCDALTSVALPSSLTSLGTGVFFNNVSLSLESVPAGVTALPDFALTSSSGSPTMLKGSSVADIGKYALADWTGVQTFTFPSTLASLDDGAMANWSGLTSLDGTEMVEVPALGNDVWGDLLKRDVTLTVASQELQHAFLAAAQWQDFDVKAKLSDIETSLIDNRAEASVKARFEGLTLHISAPADIKAVQLYDTDGRSYMLPTSGEGHWRAIDTSAWNARVMIVHVILSDGSAAALKLHR